MLIAKIVPSTTLRNAIILMTTFQETCHWGCIPKKQRPTLINIIATALIKAKEPSAKGSLTVLTGIFVVESLMMQAFRLMVSVGSENLNDK